jgi:hypothetical protein
MPTKKPKTSSEWTSIFVRCDLDKDTKEQVKKMDPKYEATLDGLDQLLHDGYKVSFSPDKYHDCCGCFISHPDPAHKNHGQCLTARGPDFLGAAKVAVFKHFTILDGDWGTPVDQKDQRDEWG